MLTDKLYLLLITGIAICGVVMFSSALIVNAQPTSTTIEIRAQDYTTVVSEITFPQGAPGDTVSDPYNEMNGQGSAQTFGVAGTAKPVVTLVNTAAVPYVIWYNITTFTNNIVSNEYYLINDKGAACIDESAIINTVTFDQDTMSNGGTTIAATGDAGEGDLKDLYLKIALSSNQANKEGSSTLTILGEI